MSQIDRNHDTIKNNEPVGSKFEPTGSCDLHHYLLGLNLFVEFDMITPVNNEKRWEIYSGKYNYSQANNVMKPFIKTYK